MKCADQFHAKKFVSSDLASLPTVLFALLTLLLQPMNKVISIVVFFQFEHCNHPQIGMYSNSITKRSTMARKVIKPLTTNIASFVANYVKYTVDTYIDLNFNV